MVSRKMKEDLTNIVTSFYSFKDLDECKKQVEAIAGNINNFYGRKTLFIEVGAYDSKAQAVRKRLTVDEFMHEGVDLSKETRIYEFKLIVKCHNPEDLVATVKYEKVFQSHLFVPTEDMHKHGNAEKIKKSKDKEFYWVDKCFLQDHCHQRIRFEGINIYEV